MFFNDFIGDDFNVICQAFYLFQTQAIWEQEVMQQELIPAAEPMVMPDEAEAEQEEETKIKMETAGKVQLLQNTTTSLKLTRRQSLPASDPFHRIFDQMIQPEVEQPRASHLRRNYSLTERRRSSLLRGLHVRSSLKPLRGRVSRPASVCLENPETGGRTNNWPLQNKENQENSMEVSTEEHNNMDNIPCNPLLHSLPDQDKAAMEKENSCLHSSYERLTRRRGSAPSNLVLADSLRIPLSATPPGLLRQQNSLSASNRRGSLPTDLLNDSLPKQLRARVSGTVCNNGGGPGKRAGLLRRRSMGPELLNLVPQHQQAIKERQLVQKYINRPF